MKLPENLEILKAILKITPKITPKTVLKNIQGTCSFFPIILALLFCFTFLCFSFLTLPAAGAEINGNVAGGQVIENASITDFFSDHELCDTTIYFEKPVENVSLNLSLSSGKEVLKAKTLPLGSVEAGEEITKIHFWGLEEVAGEKKDSYTARISVEAEGKNLASKKYSFSYRNPTLSTLKVVDFSADAEKASALISPRELSFIQMPQPGIVDLELRLLSGTEILYSEDMKNIPVLEAHYQAMYWPFLLEKGKDYTAFLKIRAHSPALTSIYLSDFRAGEDVEILDRDVDVDEYGASVTLVGKSQVPFDGVVRVVLTSGAGEEWVFEEPADILPAGREDTLGIIWQGVPRGDYNVKIYALNLEGEVLDSHETVLRVFEPVSMATPVEESPGPGAAVGLGVFLVVCLCLFSGRKKNV